MEVELVALEACLPPCCAVKVFFPRLNLPSLAICMSVFHERAVLCRGGIALEMSKDHKPMSEDEKYRIERAGGFINAVC